MRKKVDTTKPHYRIVHFYARPVEPTFSTLQGALASMETRRLESKCQSYSQLWEMNNETDGEMVGFFEDGAPATLETLLPTSAKLVKPQ